MGRILSVCVPTIVIAGMLTACAGAAAPAAAAAGDGGLADERIVLPAGDPALRAALRRRAPLAFRFSPDGARVLFTRPTEPNPQNPAGDGEDGGRLVLREIDTGKETPVAANLPPGMADVHVRFNFFDPAGKHLVAIDSAADAPGGGVRVVIVDVATGNVTPTQAVGPMLMGRFDQTGGRVLVSTQMETSVADLPELKDPRKLALPGFVQSVCPMADVACAIVPPTKEEAVAARAIGQRRQHGLVLFDYAGNKLVAQLPISPHNNALDDVETQWTSDGRYLFYVDYDAPPRGGPPVRGTRVWDRAQSKPAGFIPLATPVGAGPSPTTMVLNGTGDRNGRAAAVFDAAKGAAIPLGDGTTDVVHAAGGFVLYLKGVREQTELRVARIVAGRAVSMR